MGYFDLNKDVNSTTIGATFSGAMSGGGIGALIGFGSSLLLNRETRMKMDALKKQVANMPQWSIPKEYTDAIAMYDRATTGMMPTYALAQQNIEKGGANAMSEIDQSASTSAGSTEAKLKAFSGIQDSYNTLAGQQAAYQSASQDKLANAKTTYAEQKAQQFNMNELAPWKYKTEIASNNLMQERINADKAMTQIQSSLPEASDFATASFSKFKLPNFKITKSAFQPIDMAHTYNYE
jgi:hypothetical protein